VVKKDGKWVRATPRKPVLTTKELLKMKPLRKVTVSFPAGKFEVFVWKGRHTRVFRRDAKGKLVEVSGNLLGQVYERFSGMARKKPPKKI